MATNPVDRVHNFTDGTIGFVSRNNKSFFPIIRVKVRIADGEVKRAALARAAHRILNTGERAVPMFTREEDGFNVHYFTASEEGADSRQTRRMAEPEQHRIDGPGNRKVSVGVQQVST